MPHRLSGHDTLHLGLFFNPRTPVATPLAHATVVLMELGMFRVNLVPIKKVPVANTAVTPRIECVVALSDPSHTFLLPTLAHNDSSPSLRGPAHTTMTNTVPHALPMPFACSDDGQRRVRLNPPTGIWPLCGPVEPTHQPPWHPARLLAQSGD